MSEQQQNPEIMTNPVEFLIEQTVHIKELRARIESDDPIDILLRQASELALQNTIEIVQDTLESPEVADRFAELDSQRSTLVESVQSLPNLSDQQRLESLQAIYTSEQFNDHRIITAAHKLVGAVPMEAVAQVEPVPVGIDTSKDGLDVSLEGFDGSEGLDDSDLEGPEQPTSEQKTEREPTETTISFRSIDGIPKMKIGKGRGKLYPLKTEREDAEDYTALRIAAIKMFEGNSGEWLTMTGIISNLAELGLIEKDRPNPKTDPEAVQARRLQLSSIRGFLLKVEFYGQNLFEYNGNRRKSAYRVNPSFVISEVKNLVAEAQPEAPQQQAKASKKKIASTETAEQKYVITDSMAEKIERDELPIFELSAALKSLDNRRELIDYFGGTWVSDSYLDRVSKILEDEGIKAPEEYHDPQKKQALRNRFMAELSEIISNDDLYEKLFDLADQHASKSDGHKAIQELLFELTELEDIEWAIIKETVIPAQRIVQNYTNGFSGSAGATSDPRFETKYIITDVNGGDAKIVVFRSGEKPREVQPRLFGVADEQDELLPPEQVHSSRTIDPASVTNRTPEPSSSIKVSAPTPSKGTIPDAEVSGRSEKTKKPDPKWLRAAVENAKTYLDNIVSNMEVSTRSTTEEILKKDTVTVKDIVNFIPNVGGKRSGLKTVIAAINAGLLNGRGSTAGKEQIESLALSLTDVLMISTLSTKNGFSKPQLKKVRDRIEETIVQPYLEG